MDVFISQPINDRSDAEILAERVRVLDKLTEVYGEGIDVIDSFLQVNGVEAEEDCKIVPLSYLGMSIQKLAEADLAYFCKGWEDARGCRIEHECAVSYGIPIMEEQ